MNKIKSIVYKQSYLDISKPWYGDETISDGKVEYPYLIDKEHFVMLCKDLSYLITCLSRYNLNNIDSLLNLYMSRGDIYEINEHTKMFWKYIKAFESKDMLINIFSTPQEISANLDSLVILLAKWCNYLIKIPLHDIFELEKNVDSIKEL